MIIHCSLYYNQKITKRNHNAAHQTKSNFKTYGGSHLKGYGCYHIQHQFELLCLDPIHNRADASLHNEKTLLRLDSQGKSKFLCNSQKWMRINTYPKVKQLRGGELQVCLGWGIQVARKDSTGVDMNIVSGLANLKLYVARFGAYKLNEIN